MMSTTDLINFVGDDRLKIQNLDKCTKELKWTQKSGSTISFVSDMKVMPNGETEMLGLVVWIPREAVEAWVAKHKTQDLQAKERQ